MTGLGGRRGALRGLMLREAEADALRQLDVLLGAPADALVLLLVQRLAPEALRRGGFGFLREVGASRGGSVFREVARGARADETAAVRRARSKETPSRAATQWAKHCSTRLLYIFSESFICIVSRLRMNSGFWCSGMFWSAFIADTGRRRALRRDGWRPGRRRGRRGGGCGGGLDFELNKVQQTRCSFPQRRVDGLVKIGRAETPPTSSPRPSSRPSSRRRRLRPSSRRSPRPWRRRPRPRPGSSCRPARRSSGPWPGARRSWP